MVKIPNWHEATSLLKLLQNRAFGQPKTNIQPEVIEQNLNPEHRLGNPIPSINGSRCGDREKFVIYIESGMIRRVRHSASGGGICFPLQITERRYILLD